MLLMTILVFTVSVATVTSIPPRYDTSNQTGFSYTDKEEFVNETESQHNATDGAPTTAGLSRDIKSDSSVQQPRIANFSHPPSPKAVNLWEDGVIPFVVDGNLTAEAKRILFDAMIKWQDDTCVVFVDKTTEHKDYVVFTKLPCGCCAPVGNLRTGPQAVSLGNGCESIGIVLHELGHVIGFADETNLSTQATTQLGERINASDSVNGSDANITHEFELLANLTEDVNLTGVAKGVNKPQGKQVASISRLEIDESIMVYGEVRFQSKVYSNNPNDVKYVDSADFIIDLKMKLYTSDVKATKELYNCPQCGESIQDNKGIIKYISAKNASSMCQWRIIAGYGEVIFFNITKLQLNGSCDENYLEIRDGPGKKSSLLNKLCAGHFPLTVTSTGSRMFIEHTSGTGLGNEFEGNYTILCGRDVDVKNQVYLASPNYPYDYLANKSCSWKLSAGKGFKVLLELEQFKLEGSEGCRSDYLEVRDGATASSKLMGRYCSRSIPKTFVSSGDSLFVSFVSDGNYQTSGFFAKVVKQKVT